MRKLAFQKFKPLCKLDTIITERSHAETSEMLYFEVVLRLNCQKKRNRQK